MFPNEKEIILRKILFNELKISSVETKFFGTKICEIDNTRHLKKFREV